MLVSAKFVLRQFCPRHTAIASTFRFHSAVKKYKQSDDDISFEPEKSDSTKSINVAVIGAPNAGKSSFINAVMHQRICPISRKVHTTQTLARAISNNNGIQMVLCDTPGMNTVTENQKYKLGNELLAECHSSIEGADLIAVIHDVSNAHTQNALHPTVLEALITFKTVPAVLVMTKVDKVPSKRVLLDLAHILTEGTLKCRQRKYVAGKRGEDQLAGDVTQPVLYKNQKPAGWPYFSDVFMVSALTGDGIPHVTDYFCRRAIERAVVYPKHVYTDQRLEQSILDNVRAVLLDYLPREVPYNTTCKMEAFHFQDTDVQVRIIAHVNITSSRSRYAKVICGRNNRRIQKISRVVLKNVRALYNVSYKIVLHVVENGKRRFSVATNHISPMKICIYDDTSSDNNK